MKKLTLLSLCALFVLSFSFANSIDTDGDQDGGSGDKVAFFELFPFYPKFPYPDKQIDPDGDISGGAGQYHLNWKV